MDGGDVLAAAVALLAGVAGALAGYVGAMRSVARSLPTARAANAIALAQALLDSGDQELRRVGEKLLLSAVEDLGASEDTPDLIRRATRTPDVLSALDSGRNLGDDVEYEYDEGGLEDDDG